VGEMEFEMLHRREVDKAREEFEIEQAKSTRLIVTTMTNTTPCSRCDGHGKYCRDCDCWCGLADELVSCPACNGTGQQPQRKETKCLTT